MFCPKCGKELSDGSKFCDGCGQPIGGAPVDQKKKKKKHPVLGGILLVLGILIIIGVVSGGGSDEPKKVSESTVATATQATEPEVFTVGDTVEMKGVKVTLNAVTESNGSKYMKPTDGNVFVICEFTIENGSDSEMAVSSMMSFQAYFDGYAANLNLGATATADGKNQLDGTVADGKKINGIVGYEAPTDWEELEIHFSPSVYSGKDFIFTAQSQHTSDGAPESEPLVENDKISAYFIGSEDQKSLGVFYVTLKIENKTDCDMLVTLEDADVDGESIPLITTGVPLVIKPGNSGQTGFIFSMANLSISSMSEAEKATFRIIARNNDTFDEIFKSDFVTVDLNK